MQNREFGFKEILIKVVEEKNADFTGGGSDENTVVEGEIMAVGRQTEFYKVGDKVLVKKHQLKDKVNHRLFQKNEYLLEFERQVICKII